jgi:hypothetical protein
MNFQEYYEVVLQNISRNVIPIHIMSKTSENLREFIYDMYTKDFGTSMTVIIVESLYINYREFFK